MTTPDNSLGLQLEQLQIATTEPVQPVSPNDSSPQEEQSKKKQKPYINPERFKTGGPQREKLSDDELAERMQRIKAQNEKIKQRRLDVEADEEAFKKTQQEEQVKAADVRKVQDKVNRAREQNAKRKMERVESREWDSGKSTGAAEIKTVTAMTSPVESQWTRGGSRGRPGRGTRRGKGGRDGHDTPLNAAPPISSAQSPLEEESRDTAS